jgi:hypothetical protein
LSAMRLAAVLIVAASCLVTSVVCAADVVIDATVDRGKVPVGEPLRITITLENRSSASALFVVRDANFIVEVATAEGTRTVESPRITAERSHFVDDEVPLRPASAYRRVLSIPLNDLSATLGEGWLPEPGRYSLNVVYDSERSMSDHSPWIWRGSARSETMRIDITPPTATTVATMRQRLEECVRDSRCDSITLANFYRIVCDPSVRDSLIQLLRNMPYDVWLLDAIVAQGRVSDAKRVREIGSDLSDESLRRSFMEAAQMLERSSEQRARDGSPRCGLGKG